MLGGAGHRGEWANPLAQYGDVNRLVHERTN